MKKVLLLSIIIMLIGNSVFSQKDFFAPHIVKEGTVIVKGEAISGSKAALYESFETAVPPAGWNKVNPDGGSGWAQIADATSPLPGWTGGTMTIPPSGGSNAAYCTWNTGGSSSNDQWLITPALDIETGDMLKFWIWHYSEYGDNVQILLSTTDINTSSFTETIADINYDTTVDWTEHTYDLSAFAGQTVYIGFRDLVADNQTDGGFVAIDLVQVSPPVANDVAVSALSVNDISPIGTIDVTGTILNFGTNQINSVDLNWQVDNGIVNTENVSGLSIPTNDTYDFIHSIQWNAASAGNYNLKVWASNMNGIGNDQNPNNDTIQKTINVISAVDAGLFAITTPETADQGMHFVTGRIKNEGANNITSFDITYNIDGGAESSVYNVSGTDIVYNETYNFKHDIPYDFNADDTYSIHVSISNVNGGGETDLSDNSLSKDINIVSGYIQKKVIVENFTTGPCPNCPPIHVLLEDYTAGEPNAILIAQHAGYYTDEMSIPENTELLALYNDGGSTYAPALSIDRHHYSSGLVTSSPDPGPVFWPGESTSNTVTRIDEKLDIPTNVKLEIYGSVLPSGDIDFYIAGHLAGDISGEDLRLAAYILEDGLIYSQSGGSADYEHNNVMRDAISETWGDNEIITNNTSGTKFFKHYIYTPDASWVTNNLSLVGFVANYDAGNVNNREILNGEEVKLSDLTLPAPAVSYNPADSEIDVHVLADITINFNQTMRLVNDDPITNDNVSDFIHISDPAKGDLTYTASINSDQTEIIITPDVPFSETVTVTVTIDNNELENISDVVLSGNSFSFITDTNPEANVVFSPINGSSDIYVNSNITLTFDNAMRKLDDSEITDGDISSIVTLTDPSKGEIAYTGTINAEKTIITIDPDEYFTILTDVTVSILDAVVENQFDKVLSASSATFTTYATTGISTLFSNISIYPNPAVNTVTITNAEKLSVSLFDIYGKLLLKKQIDSDYEEIDITYLASGFYILNLETEGFKSSKKLIISK